MNSLLLLLFFPPLVLPCAIDWAQCDKATCFSKYAKRDGLALHAKGQPAPTVGLSLQWAEKPFKPFSYVKEGETKVVRAPVTTVGIQVTAPGMQDADYAAIVVGDKILAGCHKGAQALKIAFGKYAIQDDAGAKRKYVNNAFCCQVDVAHLDLEYLEVSSTLPLAVNYTTDKTIKTVTLFTDFSAYQILRSLAHREKVTCDISAFRADNFESHWRPYYPLQDPTRASCDIDNHAIRTYNEGAYNKESRYVPVCEAGGKWSLANKAVDFSKFPPRCVQRPKQGRRSCAGHTPPTELLCGEQCGRMNAHFFRCERSGTVMHVLDNNSTTWQKVDSIDCTDRGFVASASDTRTLLSPHAKVQCRVTDVFNPPIKFIAYSRYIAVILGIVVYLIVFIGFTIGCCILFKKCAAKVEEIGPIRSGSNGPLLSKRAQRKSANDNSSNNTTNNNKNSNNNNNNNTENRDESNRNEASNRMATKRNVTTSNRTGKSVKSN